MEEVGAKEQHGHEALSAAEEELASFASDLTAE
jgi:hypothetical protein